MAVARGADFLQSFVTSRNKSLLLLRGSLGYVAFLCFVEASVLLPLANLALLSRYSPVDNLAWGQGLDRF